MKGENIIAVIEKYRNEAAHLGVYLRDKTMPELVNSFLSEIRCLPSSGKREVKLGRKPAKISGVVYETTGYEYYEGFILDTVREIRAKRSAYVFKLSHIADVMKYEKDFDADYLEDSDSFKLYARKEKNFI